MRQKKVNDYPRAREVSNPEHRVVPRRRGRGRHKSRLWVNRDVQPLDVAAEAVRMCAGRHRAIVRVAGWSILVRDGHAVAARKLYRVASR